MAVDMCKWLFKRGPITKIMPSNGGKGDTVPLAVGQLYGFHEFGGYLGNVGLYRQPQIEITNSVCVIESQGAS